MPRRCVGCGGDVAAVEEHAAGVGGEEPGDDAQQRALAAARRPEEGDDLAAGDGQATRRSRTGVPSNADGDVAHLEHHGSVMIAGRR